MEHVSAEEVQSIANLARVALDDSEATAMASNLTSILSHFEAIRAIDTTGVLPADDVSGLKNVTREDIVRANVLGDPEVLMNNAPASYNGYVKVSAVFSDADIL